MAFDFPAAPTVGQQYTVGTATYQWDGTAWNLVPLIVPPIATPTPPANPYNGQLWWNAENGKLYVWYVDVDSAQWVQVAGYNGTQKTAQTRNRLTNGAMQISQENGDTGGSISSVQFYPVDMWMGTAALAAASAGRSTPDVVSPNGNRVIYCGVSTGKPTLAAGDHLQLINTVEGLQVLDFGWGTANAKPAIMRFAAWTNLAGTYTAKIMNGANNRTFLAPLTLAANRWTEFEIAVPGDTTGTWATDNTAGLKVSFTFAAGATHAVGVSGWQAGNIGGLSGMSNGAAVSGGTLRIGDVGLHLDPDNTGKAPPFQVSSYADELARCQRYYQLINMYLAGYSSGAITLSYRQMLPVPMRTAPTFGSVGVANNNCAGSTITTEGQVDVVRLGATGVAAGGFISSAYGSLSARM